MRRAGCSLGALALAVVLGGSATAEPPASQPAPAPGPCAADIDRFCKKVARGAGRRRACLLSHASALAVGCRSRLQATPATTVTNATLERIPERLIACETDLRMRCPGVSPGDGRLRACLDLHADKLTAGCAAALKGR